MSKLPKILFFEGNADGTVGGSYFSLLFLVEALDRSKYTPVVAFRREIPFIQRFRDAGFEVRTGESLGRHLDRAQTVVWTPDNYDLPSEEVCDFFDKWLSARPGRTLVYVGRDYDAVYDYWSDMADRLNGAEKVKALRKKAQPTYGTSYLRTSRDFDRDHRWFVQEDAPVAGRVEELAHDRVFGIVATDFRVHVHVDGADLGKVYGQEWVLEQ